MNDPDIKIVKTGKSTLTYKLGKSSDDELYLRIKANTGGTVWNADWISMSAIQEALAKQTAEIVSAVALYSLFRSKSVNTPAFLLAALIHLGLVKACKGKRLRHDIAEDFSEKVAKLKATGKSKPAARKKGRDESTRPEDLSQEAQRFQEISHLRSGDLAYRRYKRPLLDSRSTIIDGYLKWLTGHVCNQEASMSGNVVYVGIDVDDVQYHGSALDRRTGEVLRFQCRPTLKGLIGQLDKVRKHFGGVELKLCYEASYVGFSLQRDLAERGYPCEVVSPSSIPRRAGKAVKTDRIDAAELAEYYANGLLSIVAEPDAEIEQDRDLLRSRQRLIQRQGDLRRHILSLLRRNGLHYKAGCASKTHWRTHHYGWLDRTIADCTGSLKVNLSLLLRQLKNLDEILAAYGVEVEALAVSSRFEEPVKALTCYKGIKHLFALTMITEIGDVKRFVHPRQLVSWAGMDIREYASSGKSNRLGITRQGNRYLRTALIEANQRGYRSAVLGKDVKARRAKSRSQYVAIADRCLQRLNKKGNRLLLAGKHRTRSKSRVRVRWSGVSGSH